MAAVLRHAPVESTDTAWQNAVLNELRLIRQLLERDRRPVARATIDTVLPLLSAVVGERAFSAKEVMAHAGLVDEDLRTALDAAGLSTARRLGKWLRSIEHQTIAGARLERIGLDRDGVVWRVWRI
jgi:hypothetical protein